MKKLKKIKGKKPKARFGKFKKRNWRSIACGTKVFLENVQGDQVFFKSTPDGWNGNMSATEFKKYFTPDE